MRPQGTMQEYLRAAIQARPPSSATPCLNEEQVVAFYVGQLQGSQMEAIRYHLAECPKCLALAREARQFLKAMSGPIPMVPAATPASALILPWHVKHRRELFLLAAMVIIAVSVLLLGRGWRVEAPSEPIAEAPIPPSSPTFSPRENPWRDLEIAKAEYTPAVARPDDLIWRDEETARPGSLRLSPFAQAMQPYQRKDFAEAERRLGQFLQKNPTHAEAHFYRGVSLLLLGRTTDAITPLEAAIEHGQGRVREEARWYLALAYLKAGEPSKALQQLEAVVALGSRHRAEADKLRQQIKAVDSRQ